MNKTNPSGHQRRAIPRKPIKLQPKAPPPTLRVFGWVSDPLRSPNPQCAPGTVEAHATEFRVLQWKFDAAKNMCKWPTGAEVTAEDFLAAIDAVGKVRVR